MHALFGSAVADGSGELHHAGSVLVRTMIRTCTPVPVSPPASSLQPPASSLPPHMKQLLQVPALRATGFILLTLMHILFTFTFTFTYMSDQETRILQPS